MSKEAVLHDGTILQFPDDTPDSVMDTAVKKHMGVSAKAPQSPTLANGLARPEGFGEAAERSFLNNALNISQAFGGAGEETAKKAITREQEMKEGEHWYSPETLGGVAGTVGVKLPAAAPAMVAAPLTAPLGLGGLATAGITGVLGSTLTAPGEYQKAYNEAEMKGLSHEMASNLGMNAAGWEVAGNALPGQGNLFGRAVKGAGQNIGANVAEAYSHNALLGDENQQFARDPWDTKNLMLSGVMGGAFGAATGSRPHERWTAKGEAAAAAKTAPITGNDPDFIWDMNKDIQDKVTTLATREESISRQLNEVTDKTSDKAIQLATELRDTRQERIAYETYLGKNEVSVATTGREAEAAIKAADEQTAHRNTIKALESEMTALKQESDMLTRKGAALNKEQLARKQEIEYRYNELADQAEMLAVKAYGVDEPKPEADTTTTMPPESTGRPLEEPVMDEPMSGSTDYPMGVSPAAKKYYDDLQKRYDYFTSKSKMADGSDVAMYQKMAAETKAKMDSIRDSGLKRTVPFEPGATRSIVHDQFSRHDLTTWSDKLLADESNRKEQKAHDADLTGDELSNAGHYESAEKMYGLARLIRQEQASVNAEQNRRIAEQQRQGRDLQALSENQYVNTTPFVAGLRSSLDSGGLRSALEFIANYKHAGEKNYGRFYSTLAKVLINNPLLRDIKHVYDPSAIVAHYNNDTGAIHFKDREAVTPTTVLHEMVHAATNRAMAMVKAGLAHKLDPRANVAARKLHKLYDDLTHPKTKAQLLKFVPENQLRHMLENEREMLSYGLTDNGFQNALRNIKSANGKSIWSDLKQALNTMFGTSQQARTALDDVLEYGQTLIEVSDAQAPRGLLGVNDPIKKLNISGTPQGILHSVNSGALSIFSHMFTSQVPQLMRHNKLFSNWVASVKASQWRGESLSINALYGRRTPNQSKTGMLYTLGGPHESNALVPAMDAIKEDVKLTETYTTLIDGYRNAREISETIKQNPNWTPEQVGFAQSMDRAVSMLAESVWKMYHNTDLPQKLKSRVGYVLTHRTGNYSVAVNINGIPGSPIRYETYLTAKEANYRAEQFKKNNPNVVTEVKSRRENDSSQNLIDFIKNLSTVPKEDMHNVLAQQLHNIEAQNASIGTHTMQSDIVPGFIGDQAGMSAAESGKRLRRALPQALQSYVNNIYAREIQKNMIDFQIDHGHKMDETTTNLLNFWTRSQVDKPYKTDRVGDSTVKGGTYIPPTLREHIHDASEAFREVISGTQDQLFGFKHRDSHSIDNMTNIFMSAFYTVNLLQKPTLWLAQPLQALTSVRSSFKNGESMGQVAAAMGETMKMLAGGKYMADPEFLKALDIVAGEHNTLHPQMKNEFNSFKFRNKKGQLAYEIGTGGMMSAAGDKFSRFASFMFFYNLHKRSGYSGEGLYRKAAQDATDNMIAYGSKDTPAIYRELGIFGEQASPLMKFAHGQLGNMITDVADFARDMRFRTALPLILTGTVLIVTGGAVSLPILAEYELLRQAGIATKVIGPDQWPSVSRLVTQYTPQWFANGLLSAATGIDVDVSMRYTSLLSKLQEIEKAGAMSLFPHLVWGVDAIGSSFKLVSSAFGNGDVASTTKALKTIIPKGIPGGAVDYYRNMDNDFNLGGTKNRATVARGTEEKIAPWLGTRSMKEAEQARLTQYANEMNKSQKELISKYAIAVSEKRHTAAKKIQDRLIQEYFSGNAQTFQSAVENQIKAQNMPALMREYINVDGTGNDQKIARDRIFDYFNKGKQNATVQP